MTASDKIIKIANVDRFLRKVKSTTPVGKLVKVKPAKDEPKKKGGVKGQMSGLDSAAFILRREGRPMRVKEIAETAIREKLWKPEGAAPWASISSAIQREIFSKGEDSRFEKVDKGLFVAR